MAFFQLGQRLELSIPLDVSHQTFFTFEQASGHLGKRGILVFQDERLVFGVIGANHAPKPGGLLVGRAR